MEITTTNLLILLLLFSLHLLRRRLYRPSGGFKHYPLIGTLPDLLINHHRFLDWFTAALASAPTNTSVFHRPGGIHGVITANPTNVEHILKTNFPNYPKGDRQILIVQDFLGGGIFNANDEPWRHQRKTASYEFNRRSLRNFAMDCVTVELQTRLLPLLRESSKSGRVLDLQDVLERFAFDNVCKLAFNVDPCCLSFNGSGQTEFMRAFEDATSLSSGRFLTALPIIWKLKRFFDVGTENRLRRSICVVHQFADDIIRRRLQEKHDDNKNFDSRQDLLSRFIATDENSLEFLRDIVISFILAGRDTTSSALTWFFWLLSCHPGVTKKIRSELEWVRARGKTRVGECFKHDELREMNYLHAALSEAMRLYPSVPVGMLSCRNDDVLPDGTVVKKDWFVSYCSYAMGRMEGIWGKDCKEFKPERWLVEENGSRFGFGLCKTENPFKYPVFHAGPRMCLGREMAFIQMKSIAALVVEGFDMVVERTEEPRYAVSLTLRMKGGLPVALKPREGVLDREKGRRGGDEGETTRGWGVKGGLGI